MYEIIVFAGKICLWIAGNNVLAFLSMTATLKYLPDLLSTYKNNYLSIKRTLLYTFADSIFICFENLAGSTYLNSVSFQVINAKRSKKIFATKNLSPINAIIFSIHVKWHLVLCMDLSTPKNELEYDLYTHFRTIKPRNRIKPNFHSTIIAITSP